MTSFDSIANDYDSEFTHSLVGKFQRQRVYFYLEKLLAKNTIHEVLELNCGTGEDAVWLAKKGYKVLATDISTKMVEVAQKKVLKNNLENKVSCQELDVNKLADYHHNKQVGLIFSNFGGLNCLAPESLKNNASRMANLLGDNGYFVAVIMPRFCCWETAYFLLKFQFKKAFRRRSKIAIPAPLDANTWVDTYYYNPREFYSFFEEEFDLIYKQPIGFFLPPSYLDSWFKNRPRFLNFLNKLEAHSPRFLAAASDHFLIVLKKKNKL